MRTIYYIIVYSVSWVLFVFCFESFRFLQKWIRLEIIFFYIVAEVVKYVSCFFPNAPTPIMRCTITLWELAVLRVIIKLIIGMRNFLYQDKLKRYQVVSFSHQYQCTPGIKPIEVNKATLIEKWYIWEENWAILLWQIKGSVLETVCIRVSYSPLSCRDT